MPKAIYRIRIEGWVTDEEIGLPDNYQMEKLVAALGLQLTTFPMNVTVTKVDELEDEASKSGDV